MSHSPDIEILRLRLLLETNIGCENVYLNAADIAWQWDRYLVPQNVILVIDQKHSSNRDASSVGHLYGLRNRQMPLGITSRSHNLEHGSIRLQGIQCMHGILAHTQTQTVYLLTYKSRFSP